MGATSMYYPAGRPRFCRVQARWLAGQYDRSAPVCEYVLPRFHGSSRYRSHQLEGKKCTDSYAINIITGPVRKLRMGSNCFY